MSIFSSTIVPTVNRSSLSRTVRSVLDQSFSEAGFEVIVVNDSGAPLPEMDWQHSERVQIINANCHERSVARNTGAAIAKGKYLHFLDDDDILLPGALNAFWRLDRAGNSIWLYGSYQTVDNAGNLVNEFNPGLSGNIFALLVAGEAIPFQTSLLETNHFFSAGAFDPQITGPEDRDLGRRLALLGNVSGTPDVVARIRIGEIGSTTRWSTLAELDRWGREKALRDQAAFKCLRASANSPYLRGRVFRSYMGSLVWNLKRKNWLVSTNRALSGLAFALPSIVSRGFWRGLQERIK